MTRTLSGLPTPPPPSPEPQSMLAVGARFADRYQIVRQIGAGGMGVVYLATDTNTSTEVVLKLIHPRLVSGEEAVSRLMSEGLLARQIRHPNIVAVYDVAQWEGQPYFTMEYVQGGSLRAWMTNHVGRDVALPTAVGIVRTILSGMAEAHRMNVVHRDLKPENVLLCGDPDSGNFDLKIVDFGIAKAVKHGLTGSGRGFGTPPYMAPEQMTSDAVGPPADLYSLSVLFYELLMEATPQARWEGVSQSRPDVPASIDALLEKGLSARARSRYTTTADYRTALDAAVASGPSPVVPDIHPNPDPVRPTPPQPPPGPVRPGPSVAAFWSNLPKNTRWGLIGAAVVLGAMAMNGFWESSPGPTGTRVVSNGSAGPYDGTWWDDNGNQLDVAHRGQTISGDGTISGLGPVEIDGQLTNAGATFAVDAGGRVLGGSTGAIWMDQQNLPHLNYRINDQGRVVAQGTFHINHPAR